MAGEVATCFEAGFDDWEAHIQADEWYFVSLRKRLVDSLSPRDAFDQVDGAVALVLRQREAFLCAESAQLVVDLARRSATTEVPPAR